MIVQRCNVSVVKSKSDGTWDVRSLRLRCPMPAPRNECSQS